MFNFKFKILTSCLHYYHYPHIVYAPDNPKWPIPIKANSPKPYRNPCNRKRWHNCQINHVENQPMVVPILHQYFETYAPNHNWNLCDLYQIYQPRGPASRHTNCLNRNHKLLQINPPNKSCTLRVW